MCILAFVGAWGEEVASISKDINQKRKVPILLRLFKPNLTFLKFYLGKTGNLQTKAIGFIRSEFP